MAKLEQLRYIDNFILDSLDKNELRNLIYDLLEDDSLRRSFQLFT